MQTECLDTSNKKWKIVKATALLIENINSIELYCSKHLI